MKPLNPELLSDAVELSPNGIAIATRRSRSRMVPEDWYQKELVNPIPTSGWIRQEER